MLTFKRQFLEIRDEDKNLFLNLHLDTHKTGYLSSWDRFFKGEFTNSKPWIGDVETNEKQFRITRTGTGFLKSNLSSILITGQEVNDGIQKKLKLTYGFSRMTISNVVIITLLLSISGTFFLDDMWSWLIILSIWTIQILLTVLDLNKTEERFHEYLDSRRSNVPQQKL